MSIKVYGVCALYGLTVVIKQVSGVSCHTFMNCEHNFHFTIIIIFT